MHTKKYTSRGSPPYPANECRDQQRVGNDGEKYVSTRASNGVYRWTKAPGTDVKEMQHKAFKLAVKVDLMSGRSVPAIHLFNENSKKKLMDQIQFYQNYIDKNEFNDKVPSDKAVQKEMQRRLDSEIEGGSFGSLVGNAFINGAIGNAVAGRTGALIGVGLAATGRGFIEGGSPKNSPNKWIARATLKSTKGRFAAKAAHAGMTTAMFACHVLKNKLDYSLKTCREAQMFVNMNKSRRC
jgi:hypothetical protein